MGRGNTSPDLQEDREKKAQYGCQLAPSLPPGISFLDVKKQKWTLGKAIGSGGFGDIYLCGKGELCSEESEFVVKLEPHDNGPLFTEMHVLYRLGMEHHRADWRPRSGEVGTVNIPLFHGSGSLVYEDVRLRFLVIDRLGADLDKFFKGGDNPWPFQTVLRVGLMVLESLQYVHSKGYAHNDIKAQNLLLGRDDKEKIYLVDFGIACKYRDSHGFHKSDEPDERKAHDGTLEFTSRDAHTGAHSRRGDLETLGYNMVHWASGTLPWLNELDDPVKVEASKNAYMENVVGFLTKCFGQEKAFPPVLAEYLDYVNDMDFDSDPDYECLREMMEKCVLSMGKSLTGRITWNKPKPRGKRVKKVEPAPEDDNSKTGIEEDEDSNNGENVRRSRRLAEADKEEEDKEEENDTSNSNWNWESVLSKNPERIMRKKKPVEQSEKEADFERRQKESLENPTPEMRRIMTELQELEKVKEEMKDQDQLVEFNKQRTAWLKDRWLALEEEEPRELTPAMMEIQDRMTGQVGREKEEAFVFKPVIKELETPKVQKKLKKQVSKDGSDLSKSLEGVSLDKKVLKKKVKTSQNTESKPLIGAKQSLRLRKLVRVNYKDTRKVKKKTGDAISEKTKSAPEGAENSPTSDLPVIGRKVSIELQSITKAIQNVLRRDSSDNKDKKPGTPDLIKKKAKEIVSKAKKNQLNQKKASVSPVPMPVARRSIPIASPIATKSAPTVSALPTESQSLSPRVETGDKNLEESHSSTRSVESNPVSHNSPSRLSSSPPPQPSPAQPVSSVTAETSDTTKSVSNVEEPVTSCQSVSPLPACSSSSTTTVSTSVACLSSTQLLLTTSSASSCLPSVTSDTSQPGEDRGDDGTLDIDIKVPDKNQLFDSLFDTVIERKLPPPPPAPSRFSTEERLKCKVSSSSSKLPPSSLSLTGSSPGHNPTTVTNARLGKDPPISSISFQRPSEESEPKLDLSFDDMSDLSDSDEGLAAPVLENILSVLSPKDSNVPSNEDFDTTPVPDVSQQTSDKSPFLALPQDQPKLKLTIKTKELFEKPSERKESLSPLRIPKLKITGDRLASVPVCVSTPPLKLKILRTNDGSWTTSQKKRKKRKERHKEKKVKPFLISFISSPDGRRSPSVVYKKAGSEKENEAHPNIKIKIKKSKPSETLIVERLKIKPYPERSRNCMSEGHKPRRRPEDSEDEEEEEDVEEDEMKTPVGKNRKDRLVQPLRLTFDTEDTENIVDRLVEAGAVTKQPERPLLRVRQERLSDNSEDSVEITEDTGPPSPEIMEVEPPPKPAPEVIDLDDDVVNVSEDTERAEDKEETIETTENSAAREKSPEEVVAAGPSPSEIDVAIHSILGDGQSSQVGRRDRLDIKEADRPLPVSYNEIESAISSILGGGRQELPGKIQEMEDSNSGDISCQVRSQSENIAENPEPGQEKDSHREESAPEPAISQRSPPESEPEPESKKEGAISHSIFNLLTTSQTVQEHSASGTKKVTTSSIFDIEDGVDDVQTVKTSHLELSDESSDEDIDEILNVDVAKNKKGVKSPSTFISDESSDEELQADPENQSEPTETTLDPPVSENKHRQSDVAPEEKSVEENCAEFDHVANENTQGVTGVQARVANDKAVEEDQDGNIEADQAEAPDDLQVTEKSELRHIESTSESVSGEIEEGQNGQSQDDRDNFPYFDDNNSKEGKVVSDTLNKEESDIQPKQEELRAVAPNLENGENNQTSLNFEFPYEMPAGENTNYKPSENSAGNSDDNEQVSESTDSQDSILSQNDPQDSANLPEDSEVHQEPYTLPSAQIGPQETEEVPTVEDESQGSLNVPALQNDPQVSDSNSNIVQDNPEGSKVHDDHQVSDDLAEVQDDQLSDNLSQVQDVPQDSDKRPIVQNDSLYSLNVPAVQNDSQDSDNSNIVQNDSKGSEVHDNHQVSDNPSKVKDVSQDSDKPPIVQDEDSLNVPGVQVQDDSKDFHQGSDELSEVQDDPQDFHKPYGVQDDPEDFLNVPIVEVNSKASDIHQDADNVPDVQEPLHTETSKVQEDYTVQDDGHESHVLKVEDLPQDSQEDVPQNSDVSGVQDDLDSDSVNNITTPNTDNVPHDQHDAGDSENVPEESVSNLDSPENGKESEIEKEEAEELVSGKTVGDETLDDASKHLEVQPDADPIEADAKDDEINGYPKIGEENDEMLEMSDNGEMTASASNLDDASQDNYTGVRTKVEESEASNVSKEDPTKDSTPEDTEGESIEGAIEDIEQAENSSEDVKTADIVKAENSIEDFKTADIEEAENSNENVKTEDIEQAENSNEDVKTADIEQAENSNKDVKAGDIEDDDTSNEDVKTVDTEQAESSNEDEQADVCREDIKTGDVEQVDSEKENESEETERPGENDCEGEVTQEAETSPENETLEKEDDDTENKLVDVRDDDDAEKEVDIVIPDDESPGADCTPPDRKKSRSRTPRTALTPSLTPTLESGREQSAEKRRKRINYLEMHTGKTSPSPQAGLGSEEKKKSMKRNCESPAGVKDQDKSPVVKNTKPTPSKKKGKVKKTLIETEDTIDGTENDSEKNVVQPEALRISIKINQEPLEYFKDISKKVQSVVTYVRVNSSAKRRKQSDSKQEGAEEIDSKSSVIKSENDPVPLADKESGKPTGSIKGRKGKLNSTKAAGRGKKTEEARSKSDESDVTSVEKNDTNKKGALRATGLKKKSGAGTELKSNKRTKMVKTREAKSTNTSTISQDSDNSGDVKQPLVKNKKVSKKSEAEGEELKDADKDSVKAKSRKNEVDMLEGVIVSRRLGRNCTREKEFEPPEITARERRPSTQSTQSNSSVKSQKSVAGAKSRASDSSKTNSLGCKKEKSEEVKSNRKPLKKKAESVTNVDEGEPRVKQRKVEKSSSNKSNLPKRKIGKSKAEDPKQLGSKPLKLTKKLKAKDEGKSVGDNKKKKIRKEAGRRTRMTGSNTRSTNLQL